MANATATVIAIVTRCLGEPRKKTFGNKLFIPNWPCSSRNCGRVNPGGKGIRAILGAGGGGVIDDILDYL